MTSIIRRIYYFLGSIYFAIALIVSTILIVAFGTFLESWTQSHQYAALFAYDHLIFTTLLWGFFINILVSSLHRWPFEKRHIPFLITHIGLLMIFGGALIKNLFGLQGHVEIVEGAGSHEVIIPHTEALQLEKEQITPNNLNIISANYPIEKSKSVFMPIRTDGEFEDLSIKIMEYLPHAERQLVAWINGPYCYVNGKMLQVYNAANERGENPLPAAGSVRLGSSPEEIYEVLAVYAADPIDLIKKAYVERSEVFFKEPLTGKVLHRESLKKALESTLSIEQIGVTATLYLAFSSGSLHPSPKLTLETVDADKNPLSRMEIPLQGCNSLINRNLTSPYLGFGNLALDIQTKPTILFIKSESGECTICQMNRHGEINILSHEPDKVDSFISYDRGFGGYAVHAKFYPGFSRDHKELINEFFFEEKLEKHLRDQPKLVAPLQLFYEACVKCGADFSKNLTSFLSIWNKTNQWVYPKEIPLPEQLEKVLQSIQWRADPGGWKGVRWVITLFDSIRQRSSGSFQEQNYDELMSLTTKPFAVVDCLPPLELDQPFSALDSARWLTAYLRSYEVHYSSLCLPASEDKEMQERIEGYYINHLKADLPSPLILESPLLPHYLVKTPQKAVENNHPKMTLKIETKTAYEYVSLGYDSTAQDLMWPLLGGKYRVRFQPKTIELPYHIRLRQARQINYPHSNQPCSYECDLLIEDRKSGIVRADTLSMNHVHETQDGYRFYLAKIAPPDAGSLHKIQLIISHDPAKYWLTYPGAIILSLGVILLFWAKRGR